MNDNELAILINCIASIGGNNFSLKIYNKQKYSPKKRVKEILIINDEALLQLEKLYKSLMIKKEQ